MIIKPLSPRDLKLIPRLNKIGMIYPVRTLMAARATGLPIALACAILRVETSGGANEFGHDANSIFVGAGVVTKKKYLEYKAEREKTGKNQGVGPCQLTSPGLQDQADSLGGCWKVLINMYVGFKFLADNIRRMGMRGAVVAYNGSGPLAEHYADNVMEITATYAADLGVPNPFSRK